MSTPDFSALEAKFSKAIEDGVVPGVVVLARDKAGKLNYARALGQASLAPGCEKPMRLDSVLPMASMTKLLTAVSVLQLIQRGLIGLDTDVAMFLPGLAEQPVLSASSPPATVPRTKPILVRHLLTHSSGVGYAGIASQLQAWCDAHGVDRNAAPATVASRFGLPLLFEPGASWAYGGGMDWAGALVEKVSGLDLDAYIQANILAPLGVAPGSITFFPSRFAAEGVPDRLGRVAARDETTGRVVDSSFSLQKDEPFGGEGAYAEIPAYFKMLESLLLDDEKLLSKDTARLLFEGLLNEPEAKAGLLESTRDSSWMVGDVPNTGEYDWSAGGLLVDGDSHPRRRRGTVMWSGMFNSFWFIDRSASLTAVFGTVVLPAADDLVRQLIKAFEETVYTAAKE